jgi:hypothetical protein
MENEGNFEVNDVERWALQIHNDKGFVVGIRPDGSVEYGEGFTKDEAAKEFWDAIHDYIVRSGLTF